MKTRLKNLIMMKKINLARNAVTSTKLDDIIVNRELIQKHNRIFLIL